jgi:hypothetical protein
MFHFALLLDLFIDSSGRAPVWSPDHDKGYCPTSAVTAFTKRRNIAEILKHGIEARAAKPRSPRPSLWR